MKKYTIKVNVPVLVTVEAESEIAAKRQSIYQAAYALTGAGGMSSATTIPWGNMRKYPGIYAEVEEVQS